MEKNAEYGGQPEILALMHVIDKLTTVPYKKSDRLDRLSIDILYYSEEHDDKGELIKAGQYVLLRRATLLSQPENEKVYSLGDYVTVLSETNDWFMCVISEINDSSKEVKSGLWGNLGSISRSVKVGKLVSKVSNISHADAPYHPLTIACIFPLMSSTLKVSVIK